MQKNHLLHLLEDQSFLNYCHGRNQSDVQTWEAWLLMHPEERDSVKEIRTLVVLLTEETREHQAEASFALLNKRLAAQIKTAKGTGKVLSLIKRLSIAASVLITLSLGTYIYLLKTNSPARYTINKTGDIKPGGNKAILTLANGTKINLTNAKNGTLAFQNGFRISKQADGQVIDQTSGNSAGAFDASALNTIETPAKGQYMIILPDGTKVWLNAVSSLRYPPVFNKNTREVQLKGEAYFEVAHITIKGSNKRMPFVVQTVSANDRNKSQKVEVLGTHFNINSYDDEQLTKTTLLEGSIKVSNPNMAVNQEALLKPGQELSSGAGQFKVSQADLESAVAWKNNDFVFREDLRSALRKVARWYDVDIVYAASAPDKLMLGGWISRKKNISEVLEMMEATGKVHFTINGRRIMVTE